MRQDINITAIPCAGFEQAMAAKEVWGESEPPAQYAESEAARGEQRGKKSRAASVGGSPLRQCETERTLSGP